MMSCCFSYRNICCSRRDEVLSSDVKSDTLTASFLLPCFRSILKETFTGNSFPMILVVNFCKLMMREQ